MIGNCAVDGCEGMILVGRGFCQKHYTRWHRYGDPLYTKRTAWKVARANQTHQICVSCDRELPISDYSTRGGGIHRRDCKSCVATRSREYAKRHPQKIKERARKKKLRGYGLTLEQYNQMHEEQGGLCPLCERPERDSNRQKLAVDHCHKTGRIRGLLCCLCNRQLGWVEGIGLDKIIAYLGKA